MQVTSTAVAALRAFLIHDVDSAVPLVAHLGDEGMPGYMRLAETALSVAAARRFAPTFTSADVVQFVASVRVARIADGGEYDVDPAVAEDVLRRLLGHQGERTLEPECWLRAVMALLDAFTDSALSTRTAVDELLAEARLLADRG